jgi:hypothetical protein
MNHSGDEILLIVQSRTADLRIESSRTFSLTMLHQLRQADKAIIAAD